MTASTLSQVLQDATRGHYAVAGLVVLGWEDAKAFVEAAEQVGAPVILQAGPGCRKHTPIPILGKMFRHLADTATVPVVCHIDHARTVEECRAGIEHGFTSVMIDGSMLELQANIELTGEVAALAQVAGVSVEGEVGIVGYSGGGASAVTLPAEASAFEKATRVDALAISIGNLHLQTEKAAVIDWQALRAIEAVTSCPLVLHGGSGIPPETRRALAQTSRVKKFNIGTELRMAFGQALRQEMAEHPTQFDRIALLSATIPAVRAAAAAVLRNLSK